LGPGEDLVAGERRREGVELDLDRGEVVAVGQVPEGLPGGDGVAEADPGAAMDETAGVQVPGLDLDPAERVGVGDLERLDPHLRGVAGTDPFEEAFEELR